MSRLFKKFNVMLAQSNGKYLNEPGFVAEQKYDGSRCIIIKQGNRVRLFGRTWNEYTDKYPEIVADGRKLKCASCVLDTELTFFKGKTDYFVTALATSETKKNYFVKCMAFDILDLNGRDLKGLKLLVRKKLLASVIPTGLRHIQFVPYQAGTSHKDFFKKVTSDPIQGEGIMLKREGSTYQQTRSYDWIKVKGIKSCDCVVLGVSYGQGARASTFGALLLGKWSPSKKKYIYIGKTSGFTDSERYSLDSKLKAIKSDFKLPNYEVPLGVNQFVKFWAKPKYVAEVRYQELTPGGILRFPVFQRIRDDKSPTECT